MKCFRFDDSSTAITMKDYLKEQSVDEQRSTKRSLICAANPHNITPIYPQLMEFIGVIETALKPDPGTHCTLYAFLMDYIKDVFLGQIHVDNGDALNSASVSLGTIHILRNHLYITKLNFSQRLCIFDEILCGSI